MKCLETIPRRLKVFLCHASEDKNRVRDIYTDLREDGVNPWLDEREILPGQDWKLEITKAIQETDIVIVCLSSRSTTKSGFVQREITFALDRADENPERTIFVIPVRLEECKVPERLHHLHWVDYFKEKEYENILSALRKRAEDLGLRILSSDDSSTIHGQTTGETSRLVYKSRDIRVLIRNAKNESTAETERPITSPLQVVKISFEAMEDALALFTNEPRRSQAKNALLRLVGIRLPYDEWQEKTVGMYCFRNKTKNGRLDAAIKGKQKKQALDSDREFLTEEEMNRFLESAQNSQHGVRDYVMMLMSYRHGLRVSELVELRVEDLELETNRLFIKRKNGGNSMHHPIEEDELPALRAWLQKREQYRDSHSPFLFLGERGPLTRQAVNYLVKAIGKRAKLSFHVYPHMLRHSTGYYLASRGYDTRLVQDYLGHKNVAHTLRYTKTGEAHFDGLWHKSTDS